jgi:hypothetical protein
MGPTGQADPGPLVESAVLRAVNSASVNEMDERRCPRFSVFEPCDKIGVTVNGHPAHEDRDRDEVGEKMFVGGEDIGVGGEGYVHGEESASAEKTAPSVPPLDAHRATTALHLPPETAAVASFSRPPSESFRGATGAKSAVGALVFLAVVASQVGSAGASCATVDLDAMLGTSQAAAFWSGEGCVMGGEPAPPARAGATLVAIEDGTAVLFGGQGVQEQFYNEVYVLGLNSGQWVRLPTTGEAPVARRDHTAVAWSGANGAPKMTVFGGKYGNEVYFADVNTLNIATGVWSGPISTTGEAPSARWGHTAVSWRNDTANGAPKMTVFGGEEGSGGVLALADPNVNTLDLTTGVWSGPINTTGTAPSARWGHTAVSWRDDTVNGAPKMTVFGGRFEEEEEEEGLLGDVHILELATGVWILVNTTGAPPSARAGHTAISWRDNSASEAPKMTIFGGKLDGAGVRVNTLDLATGMWSGPISTTGEPTARRDHTAVAWTSASGAPKMTIFGGWLLVGSSSFLGDVHTLKLVTSTWSNRISTTGAAPSARSGHTAVSWRDDTANGAPKMTIFGGRSGQLEGNKLLSDVHTLDITTGVWSGPMNTTGTAPSARWGHTAVSWRDDTASGAPKMTIFGGQDNHSTNVKLGDVHTLELTTGVWSGLVNTTGEPPSARLGHTAVSWRNNTAHDVPKMTIFGGLDSGGIYLADINTLNLITGVWSLVNTSEEAPVGRSGHTAVAWTGASGAPKMTIFGGAEPGGLNDVHNLDLTTGTWSGELITTGTAPAARQGHSAVSWSNSAIDNQMTVFGGRGGTKCFSDMHNLDLTTLAWSGEVELVTGTQPPNGRTSHTAVAWSHLASAAPQMTIFGGKWIGGPTSWLLYSDLHTATLLTRDAFVAVTNNVSDSSLLQASKLVSEKVAQLDTIGLAIRVGADRGTARWIGGGTLVATFSCAAHTISEPIATPLESAVAIRCAAPPLASDVAIGCCELVCSTGVCFAVSSPTRFELTGLRFRGGGGATEAVGAAVTITGSYLTQSVVALSLLHFSALGARALVFQTVDATLETSTFDGCAVAVGDGGALLVERSSSLAVTRCAFRNNAALKGGGGAISVRTYSSIALRSTSCTENRAKYGGCIDANGAEQLSIASSSAIDKNKATLDGGGLHAVFTPLELNASSLVGNTAGRDGGAMHLSSDVLTLVENTTFDGNSANGTGGAFRAAANSPDFTWCTFTSNAAQTYGGLAHVSDGDGASFAACTFEANAPGGTNGAGNVCPAGSASADADDTATCTKCAPDAVASNAGASRCTPCKESGMQYADGLRLQCAVRVPRSRSSEVGSRIKCSRVYVLTFLSPPPTTHRCAPQRRSSLLRSSERTGRTCRATRAPRAAPRAKAGSSRSIPACGTTFTATQASTRTLRCMLASTMLRAHTSTSQARCCATKPTATGVRSAERAIAMTREGTESSPVLGERALNAGTWPQTSLLPPPCCSG